MDPRFRPERLVLTSEFAESLSEQQLQVRGIISYPDGTTELQLEPEQPEDDGRMSAFVAGCVRSGMDEAICQACGRPWLTRHARAPGSTGARGWGLCPVCNPEHPGYQVSGPTDAPRWFAFWRRELLVLLTDEAYRAGLRGARERSEVTVPREPSSGPNPSASA